MAETYKTESFILLDTPVRIIKGTAEIDPVADDAGNAVTRSTSPLRPTTADLSDDR